MQQPKLRADFNGFFGNLLCLSHSDSCRDEHDQEVQLIDGMLATAFDLDVDELGNRDDLLASGVVAPAPDWLQCNGSRWVLKIDGRGVRHQSDDGRDI